jgi:hypothetical protein
VHNKSLPANRSVPITLAHVPQNKADATPHHSKRDTAGDSAASADLAATAEPAATAELAATAAHQARDFLAA